MEEITYPDNSSEWIPVGSEKDTDIAYETHVNRFDAPIRLEYTDTNFSDILTLLITKSVEYKK